jgi:hypothetical protein
MNSFREAAIAKNLIENENQWVQCLEEAKLRDMPHEIRFLFATICLHCFPANPGPLELWETYKKDMIEDFVRAGDSVEVATSKALQVNTNH